MIWVSLTLLVAFLQACWDATSKYAQRDSDYYIVAWVQWGYALPVLALFLLWAPIPHLGTGFWIALAVAIPLEVLAGILYVRAIGDSPLSLTLPFLSFTPVFIILTSFPLLGEVPDRSGFAGIFLVALGAYFLHIRQFREGWLEPIRAVFREKGSREMLVVAFLYSITAVLGKVLLLRSSILFLAFFYPFCISVGQFAVLRKKSKNVWSHIRTRSPLFLALGLLSAVGLLIQLYVMSFTHVSYVIAVKRTSLLFGILFGALFFGETHLREKLLGGALMVAGVFLIGLF